MEDIFRNYEKTNRKNNEKKYRTLVKKINKMNKKYQKFNNENDPQHIERNLIKSEGKSIFLQINKIEENLQIDQKYKLNSSLFFKD